MQVDRSAIINTVVMHYLHVHAAYFVWSFNGMLMMQTTQVMMVITKVMIMFKCD